jgi:hypothetical protein
VTSGAVGRAVCAALLVLALPTASLAQNGRWRVAGAVEYAHITEDDGFLGAGPGASGSLEFALTDATTIGVEGGLMRHIRDLDLHAVAFDPNGRIEALPYIERWEGTAAFVIGTVSHAFGSARARPVVWGGVGIMSHGGTSRGPRTLPQIPPGYTLQAGDAVERQGRSSRARAMDGGAGVDIAVTERMVIRPFAGFRLVNTGNVGPKYIIRTGARVSMSW